MFSPEDQQIEICLLKSSLGEIENELVVQRSALPALDAENEMRYRETMNAVKMARSLNSEIERFKQANLRLTAKHTQLKQQSENVTMELQRAKETQAQLLEALKKEDEEIDEEIKKYEHCLKEKAERLRRTRRYYETIESNLRTPLTPQNEEEMSHEIAKTNSYIFELQTETEKLQSQVDELKVRLDDLKPVPEELLTILKKNELHEKINSLNAEYDSLLQKNNALSNNLNC